MQFTLEMYKNAVIEPNNENYALIERPTHCKKWLCLESSLPPSPAEASYSDVCPECNCQHKVSYFHSTIYTTLPTAHSRRRLEVKVSIKSTDAEKQNSMVKLVKLLWHGLSRQDRTAILGKIFTYFPLIFHRFSADGTPSAVFPPTCLQITPISAYFCLFSTYFLPISAYFLPIFHLWYPILIINSSMLPICRFSAHMFTDSAYFLLFSAHFPPIFCLKFRPFSAGPVLPGSRYLEHMVI